MGSEGVEVLALSLAITQTGGNKKVLTFLSLSDEGADLIHPW